MKISASIYSNKEKDLLQMVRELDAHGIDMFHIDCFDEDVFADIERIRTVSKTPIDLHIINKQPELFFERIKALHIEYVSIQYGGDVKMPELPKLNGTKWGIALTSNDPILAFETSGQPFDYVLIMASEPGKSGLPFDKSNFQRIIDFKQRHPAKEVQVDGGVNDRIAFILRLLGVNSIVSGNYLLNQEFLGVGMLNLHKTPNGADKGGDFVVSDFMTPARYLPVTEVQEASALSMLKDIEEHKTGFALITKQHKLYGVVSNADIRKAFIRHLEHWSTVDALWMINTKAVVIQEGATLADMIHLLNNLNFIILFLPVVDADNNLKGAVLLNNLTRV